MQLLSCKQCGTGFIGIVGQYFCSRKCGQRFHYIRNYQKRVPKKIMCPYCNVEFSRNSAAQKFCCDLHKWRFNRYGKTINDPYHPLIREKRKQKSIYKGVRFKYERLYDKKHPCMHKNTRRLWMVYITKNKWVDFDTENQAALFYNKLNKGNKFKQNIIIDKSPHNQLNWEYFNGHYFEYFWLTKQQIIEILSISDDSANKHIIDYLNGNIKPIFEYLNSKRNYFYKTCNKYKDISQKRDSKGFRIFRDDIIDEGIDKSLKLIKKGKYRGVHFLGWVAKIIEILYLREIMNSKYIGNDNINFARRKMIEHEEEMKLLYS